MVQGRDFSKLATEPSLEAAGFSYSFLIPQAQHMDENQDIERLVACFKEGRLVAIPTETVYGLAAPVSREGLILKIFDLKRRPLNHPLIIHVSSVEMAKRYVDEWSEVYTVLADAFWPGPLTIIARRNKKTVADIVNGGRKDVAIRIPNHTKALNLIRTLNEGVVAPSANPHLRVSPTSATMVRSYFSEDDVCILDGGSCSVGIESTVVRWDSGKKELKILRPGQLSLEDLQKVVNSYGKVSFSSEIDQASPGQAMKHYSPTKPLFLILTDDSDTTSVGKILKRAGCSVDESIELVIPSDVRQAAHVLYKILHQFDQSEAKCGWIRMNKSIFEDVRWRGVADRLKRASTKVIR